MKKVLVAVFLGFILSSCATPPAIDISDTAKKSIHKGTYEKRLGEINSARLMLLEPGMSKSQVLEIMGTTKSMCHLNPLLFHYLITRKIILPLYIIIPTPLTMDYFIVLHGL